MSDTWKIELAAEEQVAINTMPVCAEEYEEMNRLARRCSVRYGHIARLHAENERLFAENRRLLQAAQGRGMVSEMQNMEECAVLVCGLHDRIERMENKLRTIAQHSAAVWERELASLIKFMEGGRG